MFYVSRFWYKYGRETDTVEVTEKSFETFEKALAYADRYAKGIRFISYQIRDEEDNLLYECLEGGEIVDHRNQKNETKNKMIYEEKTKSNQIKNNILKIITNDQKGEEEKRVETCEYILSLIKNMTSEAKYKNIEAKFKNKL